MERESTFFDTAPEWYLNLLGQGCTVGKEHHDILEAVLGVGRLLNEDPDSAFLQTQEVLSTIVLYRQHPGLPSEQDSTQLKAMLASGLYPDALCQRVRKILGEENDV